METQFKVLSDKKNGIDIFMMAQKWMATIVLLMLVLVGCSKEDDSVSPINQPSGTTGTVGNSGTTGGTEQGIGVTVTLKSMEPASPATLKFGDSIAITYDYNITRSSGARIWIEPFTDNDFSPFNKYTPSPVYMGKGTNTVHVSITEGDTTVIDQIKTQINKSGLIVLGALIGADPLSESFVTVNYTFTN